jgi:hypothetical protein
VLGELEYEDGELAEASEDCRGLSWSYSMLDDGPVGMAMEEDIVRALHFGRIGYRRDEGWLYKI